MTNLHRLIGRLLTVAVLLAIVGAGSSARAQDDEDEDEAPAKAVANMNGFIINDAQFDQWVFGNMGVANAGVARTKLDSLLTLNVDDLDRSCGLTRVQKKKLLLAGHGDIKRFFDQIEDVRKKYTKNKNDQNQWQQVWQEIQPFRNAFNSGFFAGESIYAKTIKGTLTPEQVVKHEAVSRDRTLYRYWARVDLAMELLNNQVGFTDDQRRQLVKLLTEETKPPRRLGDNDYYVVLYQLSKIPEAKIKPVFEDIQWKFLKRQLDQGRGMAMFLKQNGFVPGDEPEPSVPAAHPEPVMKKAFRKGR